VERVLRHRRPDLDAIAARHLHQFKSAGLIFGTQGCDGGPGVSAVAVNGTQASERGFSKPLAASATDISHYSVNNGITVNSAAFAPSDPSVVILQTTTLAAGSSPFLGSSFHVELEVPDLDLAVDELKRHGIE
jgi:hypothetical protein